MTAKKHIYLDYNATSPIKPKVADTMRDIMRLPYNASSVHQLGREAKRLIEEARRKLLVACGAENAEIIFTSSGTESNNLALKGLSCITSMAVSAVEHVSVLKPAEEQGAKIIPVDSNGLVDLTALEKLLIEANDGVLVSIMLANNETGVIQPIKTISELVYAHKGFLHCDASQGLGKIEVDFSTLNVDMMTVSGHKFGGPQGAAALIIKKGLELNSVIVGGGQESGYRAGTENVAAIVGLGLAAELASIQSTDLRDFLEKNLRSYVPDIVLFGSDVDRLPNTTSIAMPNMSSEAQLIAFDLKNIAVSSGSACSSGKVELSHVLLAMGVEKEVASTAIRVSIGSDTSEDDIHSFLEVWKHNYAKKNKGLNAVH